MNKRKGCPHRWQTVARNTSVAIGADGRLCGVERMERQKVRPTRYTLVQFCSDRTCEKVIRRER